MRDWARLASDEKLEVLRLLFTGQVAIGLNNLAILAENGFASADDIDALVQALLKNIESSQVGDSVDIEKYRQQLEQLTVEFRRDPEGE